MELNELEPVVSIEVGLSPATSDDDGNDFFDVVDALHDVFLYDFELYKHFRAIIKKVGKKMLGSGTVKGLTPNESHPC